MPRPLPRVPHQHGVFTTEQGAARRWTPDMLRHAVSTGRIDRLWRGVYAEPVTPDVKGRERRRVQLAVAAAVTNAGVLASHLPAATLHGWPAWAPEPRACASHPREVGVTRAPGVHVHRCLIGYFDHWQAGTIAVTSPARTVADIAREHGTEAGLCAADAAARAGDVRMLDLQRSAAQARDWPGGRNVAPILELLDPRSESVLESRSRFRMPAAGIPPPLTQVLLYDLQGRLVARVDFFWPELGIVGEADGLGKYGSHDDVTAEKEREVAIRRLGLTVVRWVWADLRRFDVVARRFWQAVAVQAERRDRTKRWVAKQRPITPYRHTDTMVPIPLWELPGL